MSSGGWRGKEVIVLRGNTTHGFVIVWPHLISVASVLFGCARELALISFVFINRPLILISRAARGQCNHLHLSLFASVPLFLRSSVSASLSLSSFLPSFLPSILPSSLPSFLTLWLKTPTGKRCSTELVGISCWKDNKSGCRNVEISRIHRGGGFIFQNSFFFFLFFSFFLSFLSFFCCCSK